MDLILMGWRMVDTEQSSRFMNTKWFSFSFPFPFLSFLLAFLGPSSPFYQRPIYRSTDESIAKKLFAVVSFGLVAGECQCGEHSQMFVVPLFVISIYI